MTRPMTWSGRQYLPYFRYKILLLVIPYDGFRIRSIGGRRQHGSQLIEVRQAVWIDRQTADDRPGQCQNNNGGHRPGPPGEWTPPDYLADLARQDEQEWKCGNDVA